MVLTDLVLPSLTNVMAFFLSDFATLEGYEPSTGMIKYLLKSGNRWRCRIIQTLSFFVCVIKTQGRRDCSLDFRGRDYILPSVYRSQVTYLGCIKSCQPEIALHLAVYRKRFSLIPRYCVKQVTEEVFLPFEFSLLVKKILQQEIYVI